MGWNGGTDHSFICPLKASSILLSPTHLVTCYGHTSIADLRNSFNILCTKSVEFEKERVREKRQTA